MRSRICYVFLFAVIGLLPQDLTATDRQTIDMRTKQLKMMSPVERDRLNRNLDAFDELSNDEKSKYRKLHRDLLSDRNEAGGLTSLMETYSIWLLTLSPNQRDELQRETDSAKKLVLIRRFKEEMDRPAESPDLNQEDSFPQPGPKFPARFALEKKDLDAVCRAIAEALPSERRRPDFDTPSLENYLTIFNQSLQAFGNDREWPGDAILIKMVSSVRKESLKEIQKSASRRDAMIRLALMGILKQANELIHDPTEDERIKTTLALTPNEREKIMKLPPQQLKWSIRRKYFESKGDDAIKQLSQLTAYRRQVIEMFDRLGVEIPPILKRANPMLDRFSRGKS